MIIVIFHATRISLVESSRLECWSGKVLLFTTGVSGRYLKLYLPQGFTFRCVFNNVFDLIWQDEYLVSE